MTENNPIRGIEFRRFVKYLMRYLLFATLICVTFIPIYIIAYNSEKEGAIERMRSSFATGFVEVDNQIYAMLQQATNITKNSSVLLSLNNENLFGPTDYMHLRNAMSHIGNAAQSMPNVLNVYAVSNNNDSFISVGLVSDDKYDVYGNFYQIEGMSAREWNDAVFAEHPQFHVIGPCRANFQFTLNPAQTTREVIHLVVSPNAAGTFASESRIVYMIESKAFLSYFIGSDAPAESRFLYLAEPDGHIFLSHNYDPAVTDTGDFIVLENRSNQIRAVTGISRAFLNDQVRPVRDLLMLYTLVIYAFAALLAFLFAFRQRRTLGYLLNFVRSISPVSEQVNELDYIVETMTVLDTAVKSQSEELDAVRASVYASSFEVFLSGQIYSERFEKQCRKILKIDGEHFCVAAMRLSNGKEESGRPISKANALVKSRLEHGTGLRCYSFSNRPDVTFFVLELPAAGEREDLEALFLECAGLIKEALGMRAEFGVGDAVSGFRNASVSARHAMGALRLGRGDGPVRLCRTDNESALPLVTQEHLRRLYDLIQFGYHDHVQEFFAALRLGARRGIFGREIDQAFHSLCGVLQELAAALNSPEEDPLPAPPPGGGAEETLSALETYALRLCDQIAAGREKKKSGLFEKVAAYIEENYMDGGLCAMSIAEAFGISEKSVFPLVRGHTGDSLGEYIEKIRFAKVEELLLGDGGIADIPALVGFNSVNTFYKAFKRRYGTSPAQWRRAHARDAASDGPEA